MTHERTALEKLRLAYQPPLPKILKALKRLRTEEKGGDSRTDPFLTESFSHTRNLRSISFAEGEERNFSPLRVGVLFSGGQASGGHSVIAGLFDALQLLNPASVLLGYLDGPAGLVEGKSRSLDRKLLSSYRNMGGFDLIGSGRTKIETEEQFRKVSEAVRKDRLDGLVIIGGDDSNTNAAFLAEFFLQQKMKTRVVGIPKTIDGDLKNELIEISFGFDTACKTFAETVGSIMRDALSAKKYYFFIRLMGRSASHIALECALQTHPNAVWIGEEIAQKRQTLRDLTMQLADLIERRASKGKNYGVFLIPEGIIEFVPECSLLIAEINHLLAKGSKEQQLLEELSTVEEKIEAISRKLSKEARFCFEQLPKEIQGQLLLDRDPHGNVQVSKIESERLFLAMVQEELGKRKKAGSYQGKWSAQPLFLGYEGRSCFPSNFDVQYCQALGYTAALLIAHEKTGCMACIQELTLPSKGWKIAGTPIVSMLTLETREGKEKPVIQKALVDLKALPFRYLEQHRPIWEIEDSYRFPGPLQFFGPEEITDTIPETLILERTK